LCLPLAKKRGVKKSSARFARRIGPRDFQTRRAANVTHIMRYIALDKSTALFCHPSCI